MYGRTTEDTWWGYLALFTIMWFLEFRLSDLCGKFVVLIGHEKDLLILHPRDSPGLSSGTHHFSKKHCMPFIGFYKTMYHYCATHYFSCETIETV